MTDIAYYCDDCELPVEFTYTETYDKAKDVVTRIKKPAYHYCIKALALEIQKLTDRIVELELKTQGAA